MRAIGGGQQPAAAPNVYITIENGGNVSSQADPGWGEFGKQMGNIAAQEPKGDQPQPDAGPADLESNQGDVMGIQTFEFPARVNAAGDMRFRVRKAQFGDGYAQVSGDGINPIVRSWDLTFRQV